MRASGEPYLIHPLSVADILADMKMDVVTVSVGLLHDVVEDALASIDDIKETVGEDVTNLVDGVTKISNLDKKPKEGAQADSLRKRSKKETQAEKWRKIKMILAMTPDIRVVLVKLADCLHNMRTLSRQPFDRRKRIAEESREIYAPIAHRLGMSKIRAELEDLAFCYFEPNEYNRLKDEVESRRKSIDTFLEDVKVQISELVTKADSPIPIVELQGRTKRLYSIYLKLLNREEFETVDDLNDLIAVRVITKETRDCYTVMGIIHQHWTPIPDRFREWIAKPRENGYRSLHTTVRGESGQRFEVQIRTEEMHRVAEEGIAAHWKYKEGKGKDTSEDQAMKSLRRWADWQHDISDAQEFVDSFKLDLFPKDVLAFTPKGKVIQLPRNATPVDFAYAIHTKIGDECTGARANGRIVSLKYKIQNGDVIDIIRTPGHKPTQDWLASAVTLKARGKIKRWIAEKQRAESVEVGRKVFEKEASKLHLKAKQVLEDPQLEKYLNDNGYAKVEDMLAAIGSGKLMARMVLIRFAPTEDSAEVEQTRSSKLQRVASVVKRALRLGDDRILIKGSANMLYNRAPCCNPIRGEEIIGYITHGKGVSVHSKKCKNIAGLNRERIIEVTWDTGK